MGQIAGNMGNPNITDPQQARWGDLDSQERAARVAAGTTTGLAKGFSNYQQQNQALRQGGGGGAIVPQPTQMVDPNYFIPRKQNNLSFYGDGGQ